jgi:hypothetical protein
MKDHAGTKSSVIFICHPFRFDRGRNEKAVRALARRLALQGYLPLAPQIYLPQFLDEAIERDLALRCCLRLVAVADELWVYGEPTEGMELEIAEARRVGIPVVAGGIAVSSPHNGEQPR